MRFVAAGGCPLTPVELQTCAAQFGLAWPRCVGWTAFALWESTAADDHTVERCLQRALAVGLLLARGVPVDQTGANARAC